LRGSQNFIDPSCWWLTRTSLFIQVKLVGIRGRERGDLNRKTLLRLTLFRCLFAPTLSSSSTQSPTSPPSPHLYTLTNPSLVATDRCTPFSEKANVAISSWSFPEILSEACLTEPSSLLWTMKIRFESLMAQTTLRRASQTKFENNVSLVVGLVFSSCCCSLLATLRSLTHSLTHLLFIFFTLGWCSMSVTFWVQSADRRLV